MTHRLRGWPARFAVGYLAAAGLATAAGAFGPRTLAAATKPVPLGLLGMRVLAGRTHRSALDNVLLTGVIVGAMAGDRAMLVEEFTDLTESVDGRADWRAKDRHLARGALFFACSQLCYCALMVRRGARYRLASAAPRTMTLAESAAVIATHRPGLMPVLGAYGTTLATMATLAGDIPAPQPRMRRGGWLFLVSDLTILNRRHLISNQHARKISELLVLATYFAAQALLVGGLAAGVPASTRVAD